MLRLFKSSAERSGLPPGTPVHVGERKEETTVITIIRYDESEFDEKQVLSVEELPEVRGTSGVIWINIDGIHDIGMIEALGKRFGLHPLVLEDIAHTGQRPKMEEFDDYMMNIVKMLYFSEKDSEVHTEQVSLVLGVNYVITFQERVGDVFNSVRERMRKKKGRIRRMGPDYLLYSLIDAIVDNYFVVLEQFGGRLEVLEEELTDDPRPQTLQVIHRLKQEMIFLRKSVWPLREIIGRLERAESALLDPNISVFMRDLYDHTIQVIDAVETYHDVLSGMLDLYLSSVSNRMNEVMKVLTIFASIFIPLTFFAGLYGMNFKFMPELEIRWAYPALLFFMVCVAAAMLIYFRKKRWL